MRLKRRAVDQGVPKDVVLPPALDDLPIGPALESSSESAESDAEAPPWPDNKKFLPVAEVDKDPDFKAFYDRLLANVANRDVDAVAAIAHPDIKLSFGGDYGRERFREFLRESDGFIDTTYWEELERVLTLGGVFETPDMFCTPYVFCVDIPDCRQCDPYETLIAVSDHAPVYAEPNEGAEVIVELAYDVVHELDNQHYPWSRIALPSKVVEAGETVTV